MKRLVTSLLACLMLLTLSPAFADGIDNPISGGASGSQANVTPGGATLRQITSRVGIPNQISGSNATGGWRSWQVAYDAVSALKVCFFNGKVLSNAGETGTGDIGTYRVAVEYPKGTWTDLTFGGLTTGVVIADNTFGCTDLTQLGFTIPAFTKFRLSGDISIAGVGRVPALGWSNACDRANGDEFQSGAAGFNHYKDATVLGSGSAQCFHPALVLGSTNKTVWWGIGDSIMAGVNDQGGDPSGGRGLLGRSMAALGPTLNYGVPGDRASLYAVGANTTSRMALAALGGATTAVLQLGVNDFFSGSRTTDQVLTDRATIRAAVKVAVPGIKVIDTTITPVTTSTDGWATTTNQTVSNAGNNNSRAAFNDFLRGVVSYSALCTETTSNAVLACGAPPNATNPMPVTSTAPGMRVTGTGITGTTTVSVANLVTGNITVDVAANVTGSGNQTLTFAWPSTSATFPATNDGLIDVARLVESATYQAAGPIANGGVWMAGYVGQTDGTHPNFYGYQLVQPIISNQLTAYRSAY
ncbi:hypothetical protein PMI42_01720 [Bradyrhizobium sp. YR681]|uniref:SGNH/GDSL hydrolase family protein n=1 Tax=Bradyrhizobium sp. YR681 TaxID=1144344 RepID=UPI0002712A5A|nr:SGNH/GDSL hydrolase family protein [Bradyrhizobium sp. YR681]EJN14746.1 hypothetical protein PMI42_01720 [Bradyrhizobium sp. YR681]